MSTALYLLLAVLAAAVIYAVVRLAVAAYAWRRFRGLRLITCPESKTPEAVEVDALRAAASAIVGAAELRLCECSRWPERRDCGQQCLAQIEAAPEGCLVRNIVTQWYQGKSCVMCGKPIDEVDWLNHKAALMDRDHRTVAWNDVPAEKLPQVFQSWWAVCWNCHVAETFRRQHPAMVVERRR